MRVARPALAITLACGVLAGLALAAPAVAPAPAAAELRQRAQALLTSWVEAQNRADAAAYVALYDQKHFKGKKRTLRGVTSFDWKGWAADRTAMLKKHPTVAAEKPTIETWLDPGTKLKQGIVRLRFTQRWKSARYADHGVKLLDLFFDPRSGSLLVLHEDLLNSEPGWEDRPSGGPALALGEIRSSADAARALDKLGLTAGNIDSKLASIPDAPQLRRAIASAIIDGSALACDKIVNESQCGEEIIEWAALDPQLAWPDPCVRRRAALWALTSGGLSGAELGGLADRLEEVFAIKAPERELPKAILEAVSSAGDALRLRMLRAAVKSTHAALAEEAVAGLSPASLVIASTELHLDSAAEALDPSRQRSAFLAALRDEELELATRSALLGKAASLRGKDVDEALREISDQAASCALSTEAAVALAARGDASRLPRRPKETTTADVLGRELCRLLHDPDAERAQKRFLELLPPKGKVKITEEEQNDFAERDESGAPVQKDFPTESFRRADATLGRIEHEFGAGDAPKCSGGDCEVPTSNGHYTARFENGYLVGLHRFRWIGCPC